MVSTTHSIPVIDHWWQTESGWPMIANFLVLKMPNLVQPQKQFVGMTFGFLMKTATN
jgi:acyl-coenzyme A synthetase/AMP-(fatty) acid ligase